MAILELTRNNKNQYRKYPLKQTAGLRSLSGYYLADDVIVNLSLTSTYGRHRVYIKQFFYKNNKVHITIAAINGSSEDEDEILGVFSGELQEKFTNIILSPFVAFVSGSLTVNNSSSLAATSNILTFSRSETEFEESVIFCYIPPAVTSIRDKLDNTVRGEVNFGVLTNVSKTTVSGSSRIELAALNPDAIFNPTDKSSFLNNCDTPVIKNIDGVVPFPNGIGDSENDGNIYIAGVKPVVFYGSSTEPGFIGVETEGITLDSLCTQKHKLLPPSDVSGFTLDSLNYKDAYYNKSLLPKYPEDYQEPSPNYPLERPARSASNFNNVVLPEYYFWPQFVKEEYYTNHKYWPQPTE